MENWSKSGLRKSVEKLIQEYSGVEPFSPELYNVIEDLKDILEQNIPSYLDAHEYNSILGSSWITDNKEDTREYSWGVLTHSTIYPYRTKEIALENLYLATMDVPAVLVYIMPGDPD